MYRVLLVDDEINIVDALQDALQQMDDDRIERYSAGGDLYIALKANENDCWLSYPQIKAISIIGLSEKTRSFAASVSWRRCT